MTFAQFVSVPFWINRRKNWWVVNHALCVAVYDKDEGDVIVACYPEISCIQQRNWLCPKEDRGVKVR